MTDAQVDKLMAKARELKLRADRELADADEKKNKKST